MQFDDDGRLLQTTGGQFVAQTSGVDPATGQPITSGPPILQPAPVNPETGFPQVVVDFGEMLHKLLGLILEKAQTLMTHLTKERVLKA